MANKTQNKLLNEAFLYSEGLEGYPKDTDKAMAIYQSTALRDHPDAQFGLGLCLLLKYEETKDQVINRSAEGWFQLAAQNGSEEAMVMLGKSIFIPMSERLKWLSVAVDSPSPQVAAMATEEFNLQVGMASSHDLSEAMRLVVLNFSADKRLRYVQNLVKADSTKGVALASPPNGGCQNESNGAASQPEANPQSPPRQVGMNQAEETTPSVAPAADVATSSISPGKDRYDGNGVSDKWSSNKKIASLVIIGAVVVEILLLVVVSGISGESLFELGSWSSWIASIIVALLLRTKYDGWRRLAVFRYSVGILLGFTSSSAGGSESLGVLLVGILNAVFCVGILMILFEPLAVRIEKRIGFWLAVAAQVGTAILAVVGASMS